MNTYHGGLSVLLHKLLAAGPVHTDYWPGHPIVNFGVSYFKAWHWDE